MKLSQRRKITEKEYYTKMNSFSAKTSMKKLREDWFDCFSFVLRDRKVGYTIKTIVDIFEDFEMVNGEMFHLENHPTLKNADRGCLIEEFTGDCKYTADRMSYDRLFRIHWLFLNIMATDRKAKMAICKKSAC